MLIGDESSTMSNILADLCSWVSLHYSSFEQYATYALRHISRLSRQHMTYEYFLSGPFVPAGDTTQHNTLLLVIHYLPLG
jgi:hypothetical protein